MSNLNVKRPVAEIHCICGAYRLMSRDGQELLETEMAQWWQGHLKEYPEFEHRQCDLVKANENRFIQFREGDP